MNKRIIEILNNLEEGLNFGYVKKKEALEILKEIDLTCVNFKKYKKIKKLLKIKEINF